MDREQELKVQELLHFISDTRWALGELAVSCGLPAIRLAPLVGMPPEHLEVAIDVWRAFGATRAKYPNLVWLHFLKARHWRGAADCWACLQWAEENQATPNDMSAWKRAQDGTDLSEPAEG